MLQKDVFIGNCNSHWKDNKIVARKVMAWRTKSDYDALYTRKVAFRARSKTNIGHSRNFGKSLESRGRICVQIEIAL